MNYEALIEELARACAARYTPEEAMREIVHTILDAYRERIAS